MNIRTYDFRTYDTIPLVASGALILVETHPIIDQKHAAITCWWNDEPSTERGKTVDNFSVSVENWKYFYCSVLFKKNCLFAKLIIFK